MARPRKVEDTEIVHMIKDLRLTYAEIAKRCDLTVSGVNQIVRRLRRSGQLPPVEIVRHKDAVPWTVAREHNKSKAARYLRDLSSLAQGKEMALSTGQCTINEMILVVC